MTERPTTRDQGRAKGLYDEQQQRKLQEKALLGRKRRQQTGAPATTDA